MSFDTAAGAQSPAPLPLQFIDIRITPVIGGQYSVALQATLLDEEELELVGEDIAHAHVATLDDALAVIRRGVAGLAPELRA